MKKILHLLLVLLIILPVACTNSSFSNEVGEGNKLDVPTLAITPTEIVQPPVEKTAEEPEPKSTGVPAETPTEVPTEAPVEPSAEMPAETSDEKPDEKTPGVDNEPEQPGNKVYYTERAVVLTYHHISSKPFSSITIKPERFKADVKMLRESNFNVISYRDMINAMQGKAKMPPNAVVISFDDGIESFYKYAYPVLKEYNMPAVNFTITSRNESYTTSEDDFNPLSPGQIMEMYASGIVDIQSHSHNGHQYTVRNEEGKTGGILAYRTYDKSTGFESAESYNKRVAEDLTLSIGLIQKYTGSKPDSLCFPYGHYNTGLIELSKEAGFRYFVTTAYGYNRENTPGTGIIKRIRSGDSKLTTSKLKQNIIICGQGKPATQ